MPISLGTDSTGKVLMVVESADASQMPAELNGVAIQAYVLTTSQEAAYKALPSNRGGATFDGQSFTALAPSLPPSGASAGVNEQRARALDALAASDPAAAKVVDVLKTAGLI